jgi:hypothetical protein
MNGPLLALLHKGYAQCQERHCRTPNEDECTATCAALLSDGLECLQLAGFYQYFLEFERETDRFKNERELSRTVTIHQTKTVQRAQLLSNLFYADGEK